MKSKTYSRRDFIKTVGLGAAASVMPAKFAFPAIIKQRTPNIIFIMTDDHAAQAIGCYGSYRNQTPNIDRLAQEGMKANNCFCTNGICAPSRASILTGKYSHKNGVIDNRLEFDGTQPTFPGLVRNGGYETAVIGKWHLKSVPTGFDYWSVFPGQGAYYNPDVITMGEKKRFEGYATDLTTDFALDWLKNRDKGKAFCLLLQHKAPHRNWMPPLKYLNKYADVEIPYPDTLFDDYASRCAAAREQEMEIAHDLFWGFDLKLHPERDEDENMRNTWRNTLNRLTDRQRKAWDAAYGPRNKKFIQAKLEGNELVKWKYQRYIKDYLRCVDSVDENIGRVLDYLDQAGLTENTLVVYTSDQGFFLGEHGWFDKRFMYEESLRMPFLARYPEAVQPGSVSNDIILNVDFGPTFLDLAGVGIPDDMQGESVRAVLEGTTPADWRTSMYYHYYEYPGWHMVKKHYGIRTGRYKLIHFYDDIDAWELYDLQNDPHELQNIYDAPESAQLIVQLKAELAGLQKKYGDKEF